MALQNSLTLFPLLVLVLLVLGWVQPSLGKESKASRFQRQHMDPGKTSLGNSNYCNLMMRRRSLIRRHCKAVNIFIHEPLAKIQAVCRQGGISCKNKKNKCHQSSSSMSITTCSLFRHSRYPKCIYKTTRKERHIIVGCEGTSSVPIHLDGTVNFS
ncbi:ribonuclease pancreatic [Erinaceus europaeus]|uniref:Ribonuclease pancreatic n=1 Tax=Erinaceus europaeus TaxID=9365 RepID=A0ABM3W480_ERIEU|nr:ribonuclease pancreatic [Erinaceus europaeus]XP_060031376.1 ribonuclease pancreatic [Erinaceus europaeus]